MPPDAGEAAASPAGSEHQEWLERAQQAMDAKAKPPGTV